MNQNIKLKPFTSVGFTEYKITLKYKASFFPQMRPEKVAGESNNA